MTIDEILSMEESQTFDRKSINIAPRDFSNHICALANADGGIIVVGISDKTKRIEGVNNKERTYLTKGGIFTTEQEYPEFVRTELVVNAVTHRDYAIRGTEIQIKMFDDHLVVESPGNLPSQVKIDKIRNAHFARNSHIAEYLKDYKYVKDFGEGVDRMCREMESLGLPVPEYRQDSFILKAMVKNAGFAAKNLGIEPKNLGIDRIKTKI